MDRKLVLAKDIVASLKLIDLILSDASDDLEELVNRLIDIEEEEITKTSKPIEEYPIGEE